MNIRWYGHSCFQLTTDSGVRILTDPCDPETGYHLHDIAVDVVTSSHAHHDHSYFAAVPGTPIRITEPGTFEVLGVRITGIPTWHDAEQGRLRGPNIAYVFDIDGLRVAHLGDIGAIPDKETLARFGEINVLFVPIGDNYTIGSEDARALANRLHPQVLIPMHYKTGSLSFKLSGLHPLLAAAQGCKIHRLNAPDCTVTKDALGADRILVLRYMEQPANEENE